MGEIALEVADWTDVPVGGVFKAETLDSCACRRGGHMKTIVNYTIWLALWPVVAPGFRV